MLQEWQRRGAPDLETGEWAVRETMLHRGGLLLEKLLGADGGGLPGDPDRLWAGARGAV